MLALASLLERLRDDPGTVGKRYQLTVRAPDWLLGAIRDVPGVDAAGERYATEAADSFRLGEQLKLVAYPGDHTDFEAPPLAEGRRVRGAGRDRGRARAGRRARPAAGLDASPPSCAAAPRCASASTGIVRALENDGPDRLGAAASGCWRATRT